MRLSLRPVLRLKIALNYIIFVFLKLSILVDISYLITFAIVETEGKYEKKMGCNIEPAGIVAKSIA